MRTWLFFVLVLTAGTASADKLTKTAPESWRGDVRGLRWGMGPGDVAERVLPSPLWRVTQHDDHGSYRSELATPWQGVAVDARFSFRDDRLVLVSYAPRAGLTSVQLGEWFDRVIAELLARYGAGDCHYSASVRRCGWEAEGSHVLVSFVTLDGATPAVAALFEQLQEGPDPHAGHKHE